MEENGLTQCTISGPVAVTIRDGRLAKMCTIVFDESDRGGWTIEARGNPISDPRRTTLGLIVVGERTPIYSENRIRYPMKRKHSPGMANHSCLVKIVKWAA